jgi:hypothetical protein
MFCTNLNVNLRQGDLPCKTEPKRVETLSLRGSVGARLAGTIAVNVTQVTVSSKGLETGA